MPSSVLIALLRLRCLAVLTLVCADCAATLKGGVRGLFYPYIFLHVSFKTNALMTKISMKKHETVEEKRYRPSKLQEPSRTRAKFKIQFPKTGLAALLLTFSCISLMCDADEALKS